MKLSKKFALILSTILISFTLLIILFDSLFLELYYTNRTKQSLKDTYNSVCEYLLSDEAMINSYFISEINMLAEREGYTVCLFDENGNNLDIYKKVRITNVFSIFNYEKEASDIPKGGAFFEFHFNDRKEDNFIAYLGKVENKNEVTLGFLMVYSPKAKLSENTKLFNTYIIIVSLIVLIFSIFVSFIVANRVTKPIKEAEEKTKRMASLDFSTKLTINSKDEIGSLSRSINKLSDELERSVKELKEANLKLEDEIALKNKIEKLREEFISDVSHELKTPISIISGYSEALKLDGIDSKDINEYADIIIDESMKMNKMVKDLLKYTEIESGFAKLDEDNFYWSELRDNVIKPLNLKIKEKEIEINIDENDYLLNGDFDMMSTVLNNYLTNAINHVDDKRTIKIIINEINDSYRIIVFNTGESINEIDKDRIWESFFKVDKSRSRKYGGSGLGLSIVKSIMEVYQKEYGFINEFDGVSFYFDMNKGREKE